MKKTNTNTRERRQAAGRFVGKQDAKIGRVQGPIVFTHRIIGKIDISSCCD